MGGGEGENGVGAGVKWGSGGKRSKGGDTGPLNLVRNSRQRDEGKRDPKGV